jgi:hypothetical protein
VNLNGPIEATREAARIETLALDADPDLRLASDAAAPKPVVASGPINNAVNAGPGVQAALPENPCITAATEDADALPKNGVCGLATG